MKKKLTLRALPALATLTAAAAICQTNTARADDTPPANSIRLGMYAIFYHTKADDLSGQFVPAGVNIDVKDTQTLYAAYIRRLTSFLDLELAFGIPPKTETVGRGPQTLGSVPYNNVTISSAKWAAPSALLEYKFFSENAMLRPFVGAGVNYTSFYDRQVTPAGQAATGGPTRLSLTSSVGPIGTIGLKYQYSSHWHAVASWSVTRVDSDLKIDTAGVIRTTHVAFRPQALVVAVGYSFGP